MRPGQAFMALERSERHALPYYHSTEHVVRSAALPFFIFIFSWFSFPSGRVFLVGVVAQDLLADGPWPIFVLLRHSFPDFCCSCVLVFTNLSQSFPIICGRVFNYRCLKLCSILNARPLKQFSVVWPICVSLQSTLHKHNASCLVISQKDLNSI